MSNNSVACDDLRDLHEYFWDGYEGKGEPYGLINLRLARKVGRLGEDQYPDPEVMGFNPCAEQSLAPYETCCLAEVYLSNIESKEEFLDILELLYRINKHSLMLPSHHHETKEIVHKNMRMGIGLTGILQASKEQNSWMNEGYEYLRDFDVRYSQIKGVPRSIKLTTVKPSGTLSLLPGVTPGIHPAYAQYMYRRIRVASEHMLVDVCKAHGYPVEYQKNFDGTDDYNTVVVTFPFAYPEGTKLAREMTAIDQLKEIKRLQADWSDNSVSCTIYYKKEEIPAIRDYLMKHYKNNYKSLSFLLHSDHGFAQAPYEEITKEQYEELLSKTVPITSVERASFDLSEECAGGMCPIK
jgi:ribonucleoside-triphosphate reductase